MGGFKMNPIEDVKEMMEKLLQVCKEQKVDVDLEAHFKKGKDNMQYLWEI